MHFSHKSLYGLSADSSLLWSAMPKAHPQEVRLPPGAMRVDPLPDPVDDASLGVFHELGAFDVEAPDTL